MCAWIFRSHAGRDFQVEDLEREIQRLGVTLVPGMIPLIWSGADQQISNAEDYWPNQAGLSEAGLHWLLDRGIRLIGIDAYAMDVSYQSMKQAEAAGYTRFWPLHFVGRAREHMHLEKLTNLGALPQSHGFWFAAFPVKLRGGSAGWVRPVALVPQSHFMQVTAD